MRPHLLSQDLLEFRFSGVGHAAQVVGHGRRGYGVVARLGRVWPATVARRVSVFQVCPTRTQPALQVWFLDCQVWLINRPEETVQSKRPTWAEVLADVS